MASPVRQFMEKNCIIGLRRCFKTCISELPLWWDIDLILVRTIKSSFISRSEKKPSFSSRSSSSSTDLTRLRPIRPSSQGSPQDGGLVIGARSEVNASSRGSAGGSGANVVITGRASRPPWPFLHQRQLFPGRPCSPLPRPRAQGTGSRCGRSSPCAMSAAGTRTGGP